MANIKIRSFERDTVFLLLALTRLVRSALFPLVIMWQAIFNICQNIFCIFLLIQKAACEACLDIACPLQRTELRFSTWLQFRHRLVMAGARSHARVPAAVAQAVLSSLHRGLPRARSTWWCIQSLTWESMWRAALVQPAGRFSRSFPCYHVGHQRWGSARLLSVLQVEALTSKDRGSRNPEPLVNSD